MLTILKRFKQFMNKKRSWPFYFANWNWIGWLDDAQYIHRENDKRGGCSGKGSIGSSSGVGISGIAGLSSGSMEKEGRRNILWNNFSSHHAFTTGRHPRQNDSSFGNKIRPKGPSQTLKVNICDYENVFGFCNLIPTNCTFISVLLFFLPFSFWV